MRGPDGYSRQEYAKLPEKFVRALRQKWKVDARATTPNGAPYPLRSWPPDAAIDIQALAEWADRYSYPTLSARDAAITAPYKGMLTYLQDTGTVQQHNGYVWVGDTGWRSRFKKGMDVKITPNGKREYQTGVSLLHARRAKGSPSLSPSQGEEAHVRTHLLSPILI